MGEYAALSGRRVGAGVPSRTPGDRATGVRGRDPRSHASSRQRRVLAHWGRSRTTRPIPTEGSRLPKRSPPQATKDPSIAPAELERVERWAGGAASSPPATTRPVSAAPGTAFRTAYDEALIEIEAGRASPVARVAAPVRARARPPGGSCPREERPHLADGPRELRAHQVDALAGMLGRCSAMHSATGRTTRRPRRTRTATATTTMRRRRSPTTRGRHHPDAAPLTLTLDYDSRTTTRRTATTRTRTSATTRTRSPRTTTRRRRRPTDAGEGAESEIHDPGAVHRSPFQAPHGVRQDGGRGGLRSDAANITGVLILTHRRCWCEQFKRDLKAHGYGDRLREAILDDRHGSNAHSRIRDVRLVHPQRRAVEPRRVRRRAVRRGAHSAQRQDRGRDPGARHALGIGMTATDQLLQKHVGDVFPAEVADFPLAEAARAASWHRCGRCASPAPRCAACASSAATTTSRNWPRRSTTTR